MSRRFIAAAIVIVACATAGAADKKVTKYVRFLTPDRIAYGVVEGDKVRAISGDLFGDWKKTDKLYPIKGLTMLAPAQPKQVFALAGNYHSHIKDAPVPEKFQIPQPFLKTASSITGPNQPIRIPEGMGEVHYEGELVLVIGKRAKDVSEEKALNYVFGATCGHDVSARDWQQNDVQWWRAKGSDTFGPIGPWIVKGIDYDNLMLRTRLNGKVVQEQSTKDLIHDCAKQISYISKHTTLMPGDLIFTGTPGETGAMKPGDVVEIEIEGIGVLKNTVTKR